MREFNPLRSLAALVLAYALIFQGPLAMAVFAGQTAQAQWSERCLQNHSGGHEPAHATCCPCFGLCNTGLSNGSAPSPLALVFVPTRLDFGLSHAESMAIAEFGSQHRPRAPPHA